MNGTSTRPGLPRLVDGLDGDDVVTGERGSPGRTGNQGLRLLPYGRLAIERGIRRAPT